MRIAGLVANNAPSDKVFDMDSDEDLNHLKGIFYQEDKPFFDSVKQSLAMVNDTETIDLTKVKRINSLLESWKLLSLFGTIPALPQVKIEIETQQKVETNRPRTQTYLYDEDEDYGDFSLLAQYLELEEWEAADEETGKVMCEIMGGTEYGFLGNYPDFINFPREELKIIDQLWVRYSYGKFGFSVQKQIWLECNGRKVGVYDFDVYCKFAHKIRLDNRRQMLGFVV